MTGEMTLGGKFLAIRGLKENPFSVKTWVNLHSADLNKNDLSAIPEEI